jgi:hypothetical protein
MRQIVSWAWNMRVAALISARRLLFQLTRKGQARVYQPKGASGGHE